MPVYDGGRAGIAGTSINWVTDDIRAMVLRNTYTFDPTQQFVADLVASEHPSFIRQTLGVRTQTENNTATPRRSEFRTTAPAITFPSAPSDAGADPGFLVFYTNVTNDADSTLIGAVPLATPDTPNGNNYNINQPTEGWVITEAVGTTGT